MLSPKFDAIPNELISHNRWLVWKDKKIPYSASIPQRKASATNSDTWSSFGTAVDAYRNGAFHGVGFVLNGDGIVGIDLDKCVDADTPRPEALGILANLGCQYVELSPSGTGLRGFGYGPKIKGVRGHLNGIATELYSGDRYLTVTGHRLRAGPLVELREFDATAQRLRAGSTERTENTEITEGYREDCSHISALSVLSVEDAIAKTLPLRESERNQRLFDFARLIKRLAPTPSQAELREYARMWHEAALPTINTKEFSVTWYDFSRGFEKARYPAGVTLKEILGDIDLNIPVPDWLSALGFGLRESQLFLICQRLQIKAGTEPFFLSSRKAGELLGIHFTTAAKMLATFVSDGLLTEVQKGVINKASRYLVIQENAVWHQHNPLPNPVREGDKNGYA